MRKLEVFGAPVPSAIYPSQKNLSYDVCADPVICQHCVPHRDTNVPHPRNSAAVLQVQQGAADAAHSFALVEGLRVGGNYPATTPSEVSCVGSSHQAASPLKVSQVGGGRLASKSSPAPTTSSPRKGSSFKQTKSFHRRGSGGHRDTLSGTHT